MAAAGQPNRNSETDSSKCLSLFSGRRPQFTPRHLARPSSFQGAPSVAQFSHRAICTSTLSGSGCKAPSRPPSLTPSPGPWAPAAQGWVSFFWGSTESLTATHQSSLCSYESVRASLESGTCFKGVWSNECFYRNKYFALCLPLITCDCTFLLRTELREKKHFI